MTIYVVTSKTEEKDTSGNILSVKVRFYGSFTSEDRAVEMSEKYDGSYVEVSTDLEYVPQEGMVLQNWVNPGYVS